MKHKLLTFTAIAFVLFFIVQDPGGAADTTSAIGSKLADAATGIGDFFTALAGGR